jgi:competence protein ComEC
MKGSRRVLITLALFATCTGIVTTPLNARQDPGASLFRVNYVDVGQGDAIWIQGPAQTDGTAGGNLIIDGGPDRGAKNRLITYLKTQSYGLQPNAVIDCIVASHPHDDHYPGLLDVLAQFQVRQIIDSGYPKEGPKFAEFLAAAKQETAGGKPAKFVALRSSTERAFDCGNIHADVLFADAATATDMGNSNTRENNASTVLKISFGAFSFLFMGDAEGKDRDDGPATPRYAEKILLASEAQHPGLLQSTVLKIAHHGSETSSTLPFIQAVNPDVLVVMSGRKSFSGTFLPDKTTLARYKQHNANITIVRTDERDATEHRDTTNDADGDDVYIFTDGETLKVNRAVGPAGNKKWKHVKTIQRSIE